MKKLLFFLTAALTFAPAYQADAQMLPQPQQTIQQAGGGSYDLNWFGINDRTYFVQWSIDLTEWNYMPVIESGAGNIIGYGFDGDDLDKMFIRLHYTDRVTSNPNSDDFDGDGISNWDEVRIGGTGTYPFKWDTDGDGKSDYFADTDNNGVADGWEIKHYSGIGIVDPLADEDGDGRTNSEESQLDTDPDAHADTNDEDGDGLMDSEDAVPDDDLINWPRTERPSYMYTELPVIAGMEDVTPLAISEAGHVLVKAWPPGSHRNGPNTAYYVWQPSTSTWSGQLSKSYNGIQSVNISAVDVGADGKIVGVATVETDTEDVWGNPSIAQYRARVTWTSAASDPYPEAGDRFAATSTQGYWFGALVWAPVIAPDGQVLSMARGAYTSYSSGVSTLHEPSLLKLGGVDLEKWVVHEGDPPDSYTIMNSYGIPGAGGRVPMTRLEEYYDEEAEANEYREAGVYLYQNGTREMVDNSEWKWAKSVAQLPDDNGTSGTGRLAVTGSHTWIKKDGVWKKTKRRIQGKRITTDGIILTDGSIAFNDLWVNGEYFTIEELAPELNEQGYSSIYPVEMNDGGSILIQAQEQNGKNKLGVVMPITFKEFAANTGFDNFERLREDQKLVRPWLTIPETNKVLMLRKPANQKLTLTLDMPAGKNGTVDPVESTQSPETLTIDSNGPWANQQYGYEGTLKINGADALNLAVYKKRTRTLAVYAVTLLNDDVDSGIKIGEGKPNSICIRKGAGQSTMWTSQTGGDDKLDFGGINTGANGICETTKTDARDEQVIPLDKGQPDAVIVSPGPNGVLNTAVNGTGVQNIVNGITLDDDTVVGETITTGSDGIRETPFVKAVQAPVNVPTKAQLEDKLDLVFGKQANIFFDVKHVTAVSVAYDVGDQAGAHPQHARMKNPNGRLDYLTISENLSPEEQILRAAAHDATVDFNLYYLGSGITGFFTYAGVNKWQTPVGFARSDTKTPYIRAYDIDETDPQKQVSSEVLSAIAAHELAHNDLFKDNTGLGHPRNPVLKNGQVKYVIYDSKNNFTLKKEEDDKKRLLWPDYQVGADFPILLLKDECDRLHGLKIRE